MNTLTALTLTTTFAASLFSTTALADDLSQQLHADANRHMTALHSVIKEQAQIALSKTVIDVLAHQTALQDAAPLLLVQRESSAQNTAGE